MFRLLVGAASSHAVRGLAERAQRIAELPVAEIRRRPEPQQRAAGIGVHAALAQLAHQFARARAVQREESAEIRQSDGALASDDPRVEVERVEPRGEKPDLVLADLAQQRRAERALRKEIED